jgi:purine-binding chemotaxis protein CheW
MTVTTLTPTSGGTRTTGATGQMCTFWVDGLYFGLQVEHVQEVLRYQQLTVVPCAPDAVHGLINLRGQIVTALDLRCRLGLPPRGRAAHERHRPLPRRGRLPARRRHR